MNLRYHFALLASLLLSISPTVSAHGESGSGSVLHYFSSPDHLALFALSALASIALLIGVARRGQCERRD